MRTIMYCVMHDSNCSYSDKKYVTYSSCLRVVNVVINQQTKLECFGVKLLSAVKQICLVLFAIFSETYLQKLSDYMFFITKVYQPKT